MGPILSDDLVEKRRSLISNREGWRFRVWTSERLTELVHLQFRGQFRIPKELYWMEAPVLVIKTFHRQSLMSHSTRIRFRASINPWPLKIVTWRVNKSQMMKSIYHWLLWRESTLENLHCGFEFCWSLSKAAYGHCPRLFFYWFD